MRCERCEEEVEGYTYCGECFEAQKEVVRSTSVENDRLRDVVRLLTLTLDELATKVKGVVRELTQI